MHSTRVHPHRESINRMHTPQLNPINPFRIHHLDALARMHLIELSIRLLEIKLTRRQHKHDLELRERQLRFNACTRPKLKGPPRVLSWT